MTKNKKSKHIESFIRSVKDGWKGTFRKFPDLTIFALQDEQVCGAIDKRFKDEIGIKTVRQLDYDFYTGLHHLVFEFEPGLASLGPNIANAFLAIVDGDGKVIAVVDPFDPVQPNKFVPPLPSDSEQPFVLGRPSVTAKVRFSDQEMYPLQVRSRAFFERIRGGSTGVLGGDVEVYTKCAYTTRTPNDYWTDYQNDDCGMPEDIILT